MAETDQPNAKVRIPRWLWLGSAAWIVCIVLIYLALAVHAAKVPTANEFGDMLAGAFSPVAFGWFVYAVFMQRQELELQRIELVETRRVLAEQEKAQKDSAAQTSRLAELTESQLRQNIDKVNIDKFFSCYDRFRQYIKDTRLVILPLKDREDDRNWQYTLVFCNASSNQSLIFPLTNAEILHNIRQYNRQSMIIDGPGRRTLNGISSILSEIVIVCENNDSIFRIASSLDLIELNSALSVWLDE